MNMPRLREGIDYYVEDGAYVWTERYLLQRGFCCRNGCRHCPYGFAKPSQQSSGEQNPARIDKNLPPRSDEQGEK